MSNPSSTDDALLARLNALKKSSISFENAVPSSTTPTSPPRTAPSDLAARFARLGSASPSSSPKSSRTTSVIEDKDAGAPVIAPGAPSYLDGIAEGVGGGGAEANDEDEMSLEELMAELGVGAGQREWDLGREEEKDVRGLVRDIRGILPEVRKSVEAVKDEERRRSAQQRGSGQEEALTDWENIEVEIGDAGVKIGREGQRKDEDQVGNEADAENKRTENDEADDVIARVMAELGISRKYDPPSPPPEDDNASESGGHTTAERKEHTDPSNANDGDLSLPSAPTSLPQDDLARTQALEDALTARLAALSSPSSEQTDPLNLPSAPSFHPSKKLPKVQTSLAKKLDDEIETWCIICSDDATLNCLGCDGDLYCRKCWMEGHRGGSAGFEERRHRAVEFVHPGKKKKMAAV